MNTHFYQAFEERYRGSRDLIRSRLQAYLPFVEPLKTLAGVPEALDLGCGRGEWLELLRDHGFQAAGVDCDEMMVAKCRELNLKAIRADFAGHLKEVAADSRCVVSAFHLVEHLSFAELQQLVEQAYRVLKPGGLLIVETQNPENLIVGATTFYLDPTHLRPVPPMLLSFVAEYAGFNRVKTLYLQEEPALVTAPRIGLHSVLGGVSPDYAIVAQKPAPAEICRRFDAPFDGSYGLDLGTLAGRYDRQCDAVGTALEFLESAQAAAKARDAGLQQRLAAFEARDAGLQQRLEAFEARDAGLQQRLEAFEARDAGLQQRLAALEARDAGLQQRLEALAARGAGLQQRLAALEAAAQESWTWRCRCWLLNRWRAPAAWLARRPAVRRPVGWLLSFSPRLHYRVRRFSGLEVPPEMPPSRLVQIWKAARCWIVAVAGLPRRVLLKKDIKGGQVIQVLMSAAKDRPPDIVLPRVLNPGERPRLAFVSPLPPEKTGIADYGAELLPELALHYDIELVTDQARIAGSWFKGQWPVRSVAWFSGNADRYHRVLYHFGNSQFHLHMFALLEKVPGVVVLHDSFLSNVLQHAEGTGIEPGLFARALYFSHGYSAMLQGRNDFYRAVVGFPANWPVLDHAVGVLVHSRFSKQLAVQWYGDSNAVGRMAVIPFLRAPQEKGQREQARQTLGIGLEEFVVCSFGFMGPTKWNDRLLSSWLKSSLARDPRCHLVFVGENHPQEYGAGIRRTIDASAVPERISITGFVSPETYARWLAAADLAVQLRTQSRGETSAAVFDCLAQGVPLILNANGSAAEIPDAIAHKLADAFADEELMAALESLRQNQELRSRYSGLGTQYILERHLPKAVAPQYCEMIESLYAGWNPRMREKIPSAQPKIFVDVTVVAKDDYKTGIQRVVRAVMAELLKSPPPGFRIEPVYELDGIYYYARHFTCDVLGIGRLLPDNDAICHRSGDVFLGLDWTGGHIIRGKPFLKRMKKDGCRMVFVIYDIIPLAHPEWFPDMADIHHEAWLENVADVADVLACISHAVAEEVGQWMARKKPERIGNLGIACFHLGADIANSMPSAGALEKHEKIIGKLAARPTFIMVGTIEPRKGHRQTLAAFEQLWKQGLDINLVVVGKAGWCVEDLMKKIRTHPESGRHFFWLNNLSDEMLLKVYKTSSALIAASGAEGFGLPLIEAAQQGVSIIARDIPVFREVAGDHAYYFHGQEPADLATSIQDWLALWKAGQAPTAINLPWLTWEQSTAQLLEAVLGSQRLPERRPDPAPAELPSSLSDSISAPAS